MVSLEVLLPALCLALLAIFARLTLGSWLAPGAFFPLFWTGLIAISMTFQDYPLWGPAIWWIDGSLLLFYVGSLLAQGTASKKGRKRRIAPDPNVKFKHLDKLVVSCSALGVLYILTREWFAPTVADSPPAWFQLLLGALYAGPLFGGMLFASEPSRRERFIGLLSVLPALIYAFAYLGRSPMLAALYFWAAGFWSIRTLRCRGRVPLITPKLIVLAPMLFLALSATGTIIGALRRDAFGVPLSERVAGYRGVLGEADPEKEWAGFRGAVFGHPFSFSYYLKRALDRPPEPQYGALTFSGPMELAGFRQRAPSENFALDRNVSSNVYTLFRPPIEDFGLVGSFFSFLFAGFLAGLAYVRIARGQVIWAPITNMFYPHVLVIGGYFFSYNSTIVAHAFVGLYLCWHLNQQRGEKRVRTSMVERVACGLSRTSQ